MKTPKKKSNAFELTVVGMIHHTTKSTRIILRDKLPVECELEREPNNKYDQNAIKVNVTEIGAFYNLHLGYIRRQVAVDLAHYLGSGATLSSCVLSDIDIDKGEGTLEIRLGKPNSMRA
jgi:HIRAN domain